MFAFCTWTIKVGLLQDLAETLSMLLIREFGWFFSKVFLKMTSGLLPVCIRTDVLYDFCT